MSPPIIAGRTSSAPLQAFGAAPAAALGGAQNPGLAMIQGQSHSEPARGLSEGLSWRNARTLGLGKLVKGVLSLGGWAFKGIGSLLGSAASWVKQKGQGIHQDPQAGGFKQGLGYATRGLGFLIQGLGLASQGLGWVAGATVKPVGDLITGAEKAVYLGAVGLARGSVALARYASSQGPAQAAQAGSDPLSALIAQAGASGHQFSAEQLSALSRYASNPSTHLWPEGLDPAFQHMISRP